MDLTDVIEQSGLDVTSLALADFQRPGDNPLYQMRVPSDAALRYWSKLTEAIPGTGYWPVIGWDRFKRPSEPEEPSQLIVDAGVHLDVQGWFEQQRSIYPIDEARETRYRTTSHAPFVFKLYKRRFANTPASFAPIALVPCDASWKAPAYLRLPDDSQLPSVHVAVMKHWCESWGTELVAMDSGGIELRVSRGPKTYEAAYALAHDQYAYCPDLVWQDTNSVSTLATLLIDSSVWRFWWD